MVVTDIFIENMNGHKLPRKRETIEKGKSSAHDCLLLDVIYKEIKMAVQFPSHKPSVLNPQSFFEKE